MKLSGKKKYIYKKLSSIYQLTCFKIPDTHLYITVVVTCMTTVPRMHQDRIKAIHHWVSWVLRHVRTNVQELWVANILRRAKWPVNQMTSIATMNRWQFERTHGSLCDSAHLGNLASAEVGKTLKGKRQHVGCPMNRESLRRRHFLLTPRKWPNTIYS